MCAVLALAGIACVVMTIVFEPLEEIAFAEEDAGSNLAWGMMYFTVLDLRIYLTGAATSAAYFAFAVFRAKVMPRKPVKWDGDRSTGFKSIMEDFKPESAKKAEKDDGGSGT